VAIALFANYQPGLLLAEDGLQLRVPQSFSAASPASDANQYSAAAGEHTRAIDEVEVVRERHPDGSIKVERQVTLDADGNYVNHGAWKLWSSNGTVVAEGQYDMGKRVGSWTRWLGKNESTAFNQFPFNRFKPPFASQAIFNNGVMDGEWLIVDADSRKVMQVSLSEGKRNGLVMTWLPNGKTYRQASYDQGVPVGDVMEADSKTSELKRIATYIDGRRIVTKTAHYNNRSRNRKGEAPKKSEEMFLAATTVETKPDNFWNVQLAEYGPQGKDLRHGPSKMWFENGKTQVDGFYQNDQRSGTFTYWYANGQVAATGEFSEDRPNDIWVWWHENGQKAAIGKYRAGALVDEWRWWSEDGKLAQQKVYNGTEAVSATPQDVLELGRAPKDGQSVR
jgi:antitoxin component YwqK of YwqJK toxin-antitoxin module